MCYKRAAGEIVVYDVWRRTSFDAVASTVTKYRLHTPDGIVMICAAKVGLSWHKVSGTEGDKCCFKPIAVFWVGRTSAPYSITINEQLSTEGKPVIQLLLFFNLPIL